VFLELARIRMAIVVWRTNYMPLAITGDQYIPLKLIESVWFVALFNVTQHPLGSVKSCAARRQRSSIKKIDIHYSPSPFKTRLISPGL
jgi:hypothetical protein